MCAKQRIKRIVVQPGRTLRSGRRGRWFESSQSDHKKATLEGWFFYGRNNELLEPATSKRRENKNDLKMSFLPQTAQFC